MDPSRGRLAAVLLAGVLCFSLAPAVAAGSGDPPGDRGSAPESGFGDIAAEEFEADRTLFRVTVAGDGRAEWTFRYEQRLDDDDAVAEFEAFAERFNEEETESYGNFQARANALAESGAEVTGREMTAGSFAREAQVAERSPAGNEFGVVEMSFVWTAFAAPDGDRLVVGDVFVDGLYVGPDQELRFDRGPDVRFDAVDPAPDSTAAETLVESETVTWVGETQFTDRRPRVVYAPRDAGTEPRTPAASPTPTATTPADTGSSAPLVAVVVVLVSVAGALAYRSGRFPPERRPDPGGSESTEPKPDEHTSVSEAEPAAETEPDVSQPESPSANDVASSPAALDTELRPDEERVTDLLAEHGGRMKQVDIVEQTEWSKSKVSMLLSEMEDEGRISKLRVGRENIVSLAGHEPDAAGSPFGDDE